MKGASGRLRFGWLAVVIACGQALPTTDDAGDAGATDAPIDSTLDAVPPDATADVVESGADVVDAKTFDAPYVDLDATTSPWSFNFGTGTIYSVAVDSALNVLAGGHLGSGGYYTFLLDELDKDGNELWKKTASPADVYDVTFDSKGNAFAIATTGSSVNVGGGLIGPGAFIVKFDSKGVFQWQYGPFANTYLAKLRTRSNDHVVIVGSFTGSENFGGGTVNAGSGSNRAVVLLELDANKSYVDSKVWKGGDYDAFAVAVDPSDDLFIAGRFAGSIDFGGGAMSGPSVGASAYNGYIAKLDTKNGYLHQMQTNSADNNDHIDGLSVDWMGNVFVSANGNGSGIDLGGGTLACGAIIGKLDGSLNHVWSKCFSKAFSYAIAADPTAGATSAGHYTSGASFGKFSLPDYNGFFATQFDSTGKIVDAFGSGSTISNYDFAFSLAYLSWPDVVVGGYCLGATTLPSGTLTCATNDPDAFIARLAP